MGEVFLAGRILVGGFYLFGAVHHFTDLGTLAAQAGALGVPLPELAVAVAGVLLAVAGLTLIFLLLYAMFGTLRHASIILVCVPLALLGGMGTFFGPMIGAAAFLLLENLVSLWTVHWQLVVGAVFVICVLFFPAGIWGTLISRGKP